MYMRNSSKKRKYLIVKLFGTRSCDGSLYVCSCRYNGCVNRRDVHITHTYRIYDKLSGVVIESCSMVLEEYDGPQEGHADVCDVDDGIPQDAIRRMGAGF